MDLRSEHFLRSLILFGVVVAALVALGAGLFISPPRGPQVAQTESALPSVSVTVRVSEEVDCETDPITRVFFDVEPKEGGEVTVVDNGQVRKFDLLGSYEEAGLDGYFANGTYEGLLSARPGYVLRTSAVISFTVASRCGKEDPTPLPLQEPTSTEPVAAPVAPDPDPVPAPEPATPTLPTPPAAKPKSAPTTVNEPTPLPPTTDSVSQTTQDVVPVAACGSAKECREICTEKGGTKACAEFAAEAIVPAPLSSLPTEKLDNTFRETTMDAFIGERSGVRAYADSDQDGIVDFDEVNIYGTDPNKADSDQDGVSDGEELLANTDPAASVVGEASGDVGPVIFEDPAQFGKEASTTLVVSTVVAGASETDASGTSRLSSMTLSGTGFPNSFVTIFVYSEPIVVVVKTDDYGAWTYTLDRELPDGTHEVYAAVADAKGRVWAKSAPLPFVQTASAISLGSPVLLPGAPEVPTFFGGKGAITLVGVLALVLVASILVLGYVRTKKEEVA
ncbi:MAG: hypothetical protein A3C93_03620 [Candidatus Lloydbacteria bacterium RIFCSPHIGHO2_02_FULL_54_17]|uniref:Bacterial Ig-like domain-containing protein n=1 Tax=Candidatus Lloydbacteria bacterium RIFCSPHIGHO2_02_FULL_54_17 TaxID=1798664 RepID=A0A1G2DEL2_9BACT|nr:MAG: hypothetical protein A3C93_03620 [Candidatus Lloydbacteria bacterium RIFCSPHIGHO2_02_FULL_54_17]OGZ16565.1 MAG: hypothetical protein A3H76_01250 [Candidatus Lloydbacteria bacterium RIFCSPLOWO2_02_FULL_54_12]